MLTAETIKRVGSEYGLPLDPRNAMQIIDYIDIILMWNRKINLTAIRDPLEILRLHVLESMYAATFVPLERGRLADVGSGGGFPGIPLKIIRPELEVFLVESSVKKATFLAEAARKLNLSGVRVHVNRYEDLGEEIAPLDYVCSRALGEFDSFLFWAASRSVSARNVLLWIGGKDVEAVRKHPSWTWQEPRLVPQSQQRYILLGERTN